MASQEERVREQLAVVAPGGNASSPPGSASPIPEKALAGEIGTQVIP